MAKKRQGSARRLLILKAGSVASHNLNLSLKKGDPSFFIVGCHDDPFSLKKSVADRNYLVPAASRPEFPDALRKVIDAERIDLVIPNSDADVLRISQLRDSLPCRTFLPAAAAIERCQDKYELTASLRQHSLPVPLTHPVNGLDEIESLFERFRGSDQVWCRPRKGAGALGAIPVSTPAQTRAWINYWQEMRGIPAESFTLSEYLPGRDLTVQCVFKNGTLVASKMHEKLTYHIMGSNPSGVSSTPAVAKMMFEPGLLKISIDAIRALDANASGAFFVDLRENTRREPCITEINAGRFANAPLIHDLLGEDNIGLAYARCAFDEPVAARAASGMEECFVLRGLDSPAAVFRASELFEGMEDARE